MADGEDDRVDCSDLVAELFEFLDGELTERRRVLIERHMNGCVDCHEVMEFHAELKTTIASKCRDDVPPGLEARIARVLGLFDAPS